MKNATLLTCRRAIEFTVEVGFKELVIKGDIHLLLIELSWFSVTHVKREANYVAHSLARYVRHILEDDLD